MLTWSSFLPHKGKHTCMQCTETGLPLQAFHPINLEVICQTISWFPDLSKGQTSVLMKPWKEMGIKAGRKKLLKNVPCITSVRSRKQNGELQIQAARKVTLVLITRRLWAKDKPFCELKEYASPLSFLRHQWLNPVRRPTSQAHKSNSVPKTTPPCGREHDNPVDALDAALRGRYGRSIAGSMR